MINRRERKSALFQQLRVKAGKKQGSILKKLIIGISSIVLVIMAITAVAIGYQAEMTLDQKAKTQLLQASNASLQEVDSRVDEIISILATYAAIATHSTLSAGQTFDIFTDIVNNNQTISELQLATPDGRYLTYPGSPVDSNYKPEETDWYKGAVAGKQPFITDVFQYSRTEFPKVAISLPIYTEADELKGVVVAFVSVPKLSEFVEKIHIGKTGYVFLVDRKGGLLAHPDKTYALSRPTLNNPVVRAVTQGQSGVGTLTEGSTTYLAAYVYDPKLRWGIAVAQSEAEVKQDVYKLQSIIGIVLIISLLILSLGLFFFVRRMVQPIKEVQFKMEKFRDGDLSQTIVVKTNDEIRQLAESFNLMSHKLSHIILRISSVIQNVKMISNTVSNNSVHSYQMQMEIVSITDNLAAEIDEQKAQISHIFTTVDRITAEIGTINDNIEAASRFSDRAREQTLHAADAVNLLQTDMGQIVEDMKQSQIAFQELSQSIAEVSDILAWIMEISKRTKLLSLNARIEASRAGQHGLGFGVVADEIRALSEQTEEATGKIGTVLHHLQQKLHTVAQRMSQTDKTSMEGIQTLDSTIHIFGQIVDMIEGLTQRFKEIGTLSYSINNRSLNIKQDVDQLSRSSEQVMVGFQEAVASTQESASISQQFTNSSASLFELVEGLEREIQYFNATTATAD